MRNVATPSRLPTTNRGSAASAMLDGTKLPDEGINKDTYAQALDAAPNLQEMDNSSLFYLGATLDDMASGF